MKPFYRERPAPQISSLLSESNCTSADFIYLTRICFYLSQLFERQFAEDGDLTTRVWARDHSPTPEGEEDPDNDDNLPIPRATRKGKDSDHTPIFRVSDDDDDDCRILDPLDPIPISWAPPSVPAKTDAGPSKKRAAESGLDHPPIKRPKKTMTKPLRVKKMPTTQG